MIVLIAVGWLVALPALVVAGLYAASRFPRGRVREQGLKDVTALAREFVGVADSTPATSEDTSPRTGQPVRVSY